MKTFSKKTLARLIGFAFIGATRLALACPDIDGLADRDCDGILKVAFFGDSIVYGEGDEENLGGYPGRIKALYFPHMEVHNFGKPGERSGSGRKRAQALTRGRKFDYAIIAEGTNDYFDPSRSADRSRSNLLAIVRAFKNTSRAATLLANLTATKRSTTQPRWIDKLNRAIRREKSINFFSLGTDIIGPDKLHPNSSGYLTMATLAANALLDASQAKRPTDSDKDGLYDFEESDYKTNPRLQDSDADKLNDAEEIFTYGTNPLNRDSDGDGLIDGEDPSPRG